MNDLDGLYRLNKKDIPKASSVLASAFLKDPDLVKIIPRKKRRLEKLRILFRPFVKFGILYGEVYAPSPDIEGVAIWNHSSRKTITFWRSIRSGFIGMISKIKGPERKLFQQYGNEMETNTRHMIDGEYWFLFILGIDPDHQRSGYGTGLLEPMLERIDREGLPVMLDTNKEANLDFYDRFGFRIKTKYKVLENQHWGMVRKSV